MEIRSFNNELAFSSILFKRLFSNIVIERHIGNQKKEIEVQCVIGNRSRIIKNLENRSKDGIYKLPMIVITRTGIQRNAERLSNLHNEILKSPSSKHIIYDLYTPTPIDISYTVTILTKYPSDNDMIMSNFIPFFNSDLFVSCQHPKFTNLRFDNQVIMNDSITEEHPEDLSGEDNDFIITTLNFIFKTYIFAGSNKVKAGINNGGGDDEDPTIFDGFIPVITKFGLDIHAVPRHDVTLPTIETVLSTVLSVDPETGLSAMVDIEVEKVIPFNYGEYEFSKYFNDFDSGKFKYPELYRDILRWRIDDNGMILLENDDGNIK